MSSAVVSLIIAVVGVAGTLASTIVTQRLAQRARLQELEHADRLRMFEKEQADEQRRMDQLRACYVRLNSNDRSYRDALLAYAYAVKAGKANDAEEAEVATARRAQRDARAEAQMIVSEEVLESEGEVNRQLSLAYMNLKRVGQERDVKARELLLEDTIKKLNAIMPMLSRVRVIMRMDLGVIDKPPVWF